MSKPEFGTLLGYVAVSGSEIPCYSNSGFVNPHSNKYSYDNTGEYLGVQFQCVEFVRRYIFLAFGVNVAPFFNGDADGWYSNAESMSLLRVDDPEVGDIVCFDGGLFGHLAIITNINDTKITIAQQNFFNDKRDLDLVITNNTITDDNSNIYTLKGFLRKIS